MVKGALHLCGKTRRGCGTMDEIAPRPVKLVEHYCEHPGCTKWGCFGYANKRQKRDDWYCMEHRPTEARSAYEALDRTNLSEG
jgi:hypothetical protein